MSQPPSTRRPLTTRNAQWAQALAQMLVARRASPNGISVAGMGFATLGALCFWVVPHVAEGWWRLFMLGGAVGVQLRLICNLLDGMVAVEGGLKGRAGDLFNEAPDRYEDMVLLIGAGYAIGQPGLGWMAAAMAVLVAYVRALGASLGQGQDYAGPCAKQHRMALLTGGALLTLLFASALQWALWLIIWGSAFTAVRRVWRLYRKLP